MFVLAAAAILAALYFGRDVLIPFALAVLITFLLTPPVTWLERLKLGRVAPVVIVLLVSYSAAGALIYVGAEEFSAIVERLPEYQFNLQAKIHRIQNPAKSSRFSQAAQSLQALLTEAAPDSTDYEKEKQLGKIKKERLAKEERPIPVEVVKSKSGIFGSLGLISGSLARSAGMLMGVVVLSLFMLLKRRDLRDRIFRLFGRGRINVVTNAMDDAAFRVSRYLLTQLCVNSAYGLLLGAGLYFIGVPYSFFWGGLAAVLRFIPYVGTLIAACCPFIMALAVFDGWKGPLLTLALWGGVELVISGLLEPWLYAARAGISSLAVLLSAAFWTTLWGPVGLVLSTPLTVCLVVLGRHVPQLEFLYILFGDEPTLAPEARYYQRALAMEEEAAREVIDEFLKEKTPLELYDEVLIPALTLVEKDRHDGSLESDRERFIYRTTRELIEEIGEDNSAAEQNHNEPQHDISVVTVAARDEADELAGLMLAQVLSKNGYAVKPIPANFVGELLETVERERPDVLFISAVPPFAISHARSICRRVRRRLPKIVPIVCLWGTKAELTELQGKLGAECSDYLVTSLSQAELQLRLLYGPKENDKDLEAGGHNAEEVTSGQRA